MTHHIQVVLEGPGNRADSGSGTGILRQCRLRSFPEEPDTEIHRIARKRICLTEPAKGVGQLFFVILLKGILRNMRTLYLCSAHSDIDRSLVTAVGLTGLPRIIFLSILLHRTPGKDFRDSALKLQEPLFHCGSKDGLIRKILPCLRCAGLRTASGSRALFFK